MAIKRVKMKLLVFKGGFEAEFCPGVNVLLGGNGTGKTTLMQTMYLDLKYRNDMKDPANIPEIDPIVLKNFFDIYSEKCIIESTETTHAVYMLEKDILEHAKGLLTFIEQKDTGFDLVYRDVLVSAQDIPTKHKSETQQYIGRIISDLIGGEVERNSGDGSFYTLWKDGTHIPFSNEASGYKKLGFLGLLVASGQLEPGSILFWDEPENSLNPDIVPVLVDILLTLSRNGVQIFLATHDYNFARYFDVRKDKSVPVMYHNLSKTDDGRIVCASSSEYVKLPGNLLEKAGAELFNAVVADAMENQKNE